MAYPRATARLTERLSTDGSGGTAAQRRLVGVGGDQTHGARLAPTREFALSFTYEHRNGVDAELAAKVRRFGLRLGGGLPKIAQGGF